MPIDNQISKVETLSDILDKKFQGLDGIAQKLSPQMMDTYMQLALKLIAPDIRLMLIDNLRGSDIGTLTKGRHPTGKLADAVGRSAVSFYSADYSKIVVSLPRNVAPYEYAKKDGSTSEHNFYEVSSALNYGSVRGIPHKTMALIDLSQRKIVGEKERSTIGAKGKRSIKKAFLSGKNVSKGTAAYLREKHNRAVGNYFYNKGSFEVPGTKARTTNEKGSIKGGSFVVTRPHSFYKFTSAQVDEINVLLASELADLLKPVFALAA